MINILLRLITDYRYGDIENYLDLFRKGVFIMYEFKCNDAIKILVPEDNKINICILDETYVSYAGPLSVRLDEMHGRYIEKINEELSVVKTDERPSMFIIIETKYINLSDSQSILTKEEEKQIRILRI